MELKLELSQKQLLSQKMIQSIEILQMNAQELHEYLTEVSMENPVIDIDAGLGAQEQAGAWGAQEPGWGQGVAWGAQEPGWAQGAAGDVQEFGGGHYRPDPEEEEDGIANLCADTRDTLQDFLREQLITKKLGRKESGIAEYIIGCLDSRGYFQEDIRESAANLKATVAEVEAVLGILKCLEPAGVCAGSLQECLTNQIRGQGRIPDLARLIIGGYLELVGRNRIPHIAKKTGAPPEDVEKACELIRTLNPKPGNAFNSRERLKYIIPDVIVVWLGDHYELLINDYYAPQISVGAYYKKLLREDASGTASSYIYEKIQQAEWIKKCIAQRNDTLLKVAGGIVRCQEPFFSAGRGCLMPLRQAELAEQLGVHESTVSRAIKEKYLQCSRGVFPMNAFFSKSVSMTGQAGEVTVESVKEALAKIVAAEDKKHPHSDRMLAELLNLKGIEISRRTVTKYRGELGIMDTAGRRAY